MSHDKKRFLFGIGVALAVVTSCGLVFAVLHIHQLSACYVARRSLREKPTLGMVPQPLALDVVSVRKSKPLSRFGCSFELPWDDVDRVDDYSFGTRVLFKSGRVFVFFNPEKGVDRLKVMKEAAAERGTDVRDIFGTDATQSNYDLVNSILNVTPSQFSAFMPRKDAIGKSLFLVLKRSEILNAESGLFSFRTPGLRGFQIGDPSQNPKIVRVIAFDGEDREFEFWVGVQPGKKAVTQADINAILQSLHYK